MQRGRAIGHPGREQDETAGRIGKPGTADRETTVFEQRRPFRIGSEEDVERRAVGDLRVQLARRSAAEPDGVARFLEESVGAVRCRTLEVTGNGDGHDVRCLDAATEKQQENQWA